MGGGRERSIHWQPTPPANSAAALTHYPDVEGLLYANARQFLVEPPPALTSARSAADFNEVIAWRHHQHHAHRGTDADRAAVGRHRLLHDGPARLEKFIRDLARSRGLSGLDPARVYALVHLGFHDALLTFKVQSEFRVQSAKSMQSSQVPRSAL